MLNLDLNSVLSIIDNVFTMSEMVISLQALVKGVTLHVFTNDAGKFDVPEKRKKTNWTSLASISMYTMVSKEQQHLILCLIPLFPFLINLISKYSVHFL